VEASTQVAYTNDNYEKAEGRAGKSSPQKRQAPPKTPNAGRQAPPPTQVRTQTVGSHACGPTTVQPGDDATMVRRQYGGGDYRNQVIVEGTRTGEGGILSGHLHEIRRRWEN